MHHVHVSAPFRARCTGSLSEGVRFPGAPTGVTGVLWPGVPGPRLCVHPPGQPRPRGGQNAHAPKMSHVISLGQFSICLENGGIATVRFHSLNNVAGNYVRHLWGTMRVCRALAGNLHSLGLAVDSRIVRTGLKVWCCSGCGEDLVDEVDALWCGATRVHPRQ